MAAMFQIHRETYGRLERGDKVHVDMKIPDLCGLKDHEKCYILRRRMSLTQRECASDMGVTRFWFNQMEQGKVSPDPLLEFWRRNAG